MDMNYFIGEGPEAEKLIAATLERYKIATEARRKLMEDYGADGLIEGGWNGKKIIGLCFKEKQDAPYLKGRELLSCGYAYYPKLNTKIGKELENRLDDKRLEFNVSDFILDTLNINETVFEDRRFFKAAADIAEGLKKILVVIPGTEGRFPAVPEWLREVKESEFLAAQGK